MTTRIHFDFDEAKATQVAALLIRESGGASDHYLLMKCFYDLDREALSRWGQPIIGGTYERFEYGPIIGEAYQASKIGAKSFYSDHIHRAGNEVSVSRDPGTDDLSKAETKLAEEIWQRWKNLTFEQARKKSHELPEYNDRDMEGDVIPVETILECCGKSEKFIAGVAEDVRAAQVLKSVFKS
ncbi:MAG TPA: Panacea domain-containing protein [Elusimicrobiota bacterium]|nr:Panacea domain-containing protein [Elusimicrobiota bacterium]